LNPESKNLKKKSKISKASSLHCCFTSLILILGSCAAPEYQIVNQQVVQVQKGEKVGVDGEMGAIMHGCLASSQSGPSIPLVVTGKDILDNQRSEHEDYFDCVDTKIMKSDQK
jgi:hypothetical protein